ncbi:unnamed protein product [Rotaria sordida]|uniref:Uncharacterized protein n=1 Tax=Rotaria sordida TaxID=392033 RepID=A0A815PP55_9BILA|nr:unnamed protein product [Rotaria sordida]CAF1639076.1 unnamed protein product [Rotaria sordida]
MFNHILFCGVGEFLIMLSHDTLHSKQVIQVQNLIKHYVLLLILFIEQFVTLPYITALRLIELIVCRRIEMMLTLDEQILHN